MVMLVVHTQNMFIKRPAFSLIEIVVVLFLIVVIVPAINNVLSQSVRAMGSMQREVEALYLAQEGMEVVRAIRDESWENFIAKEGLNYLNNIQGTIALDPSSTLIDEMYARAVIISEVCREAGTFNIIECPGNGSDPKIKKVEVIVSWDNVSGSDSVSLSTYLTAFQGTED